MSQPYMRLKYGDAGAKYCVFQFQELNCTYVTSSADLPAIQAVIRINTMCNMTMQNETPPIGLKVTFGLQNSGISFQRA
jgi:hypothetical protein